MGGRGKHRRDAESLSSVGVTGEHFRRLVENRLEDRSVVGRVGLEPTQTTGLSLIDVDIAGGPSILFESADWLAGVRVLDPDGEDLTIAAALEYIDLRCDGLTPSNALRQVTTPRHRD